MISSLVMTLPTHSITNANQAVAKVAYKTNDLCAIYPITPASEMSELVEEWSAKERANVFGAVPSVIEMQSEAGVAGAMHGALQTGSLSTTFTASQGLLLMLPNMYKIAGELTPNVIHVATRSIAAHALSIFGDHSDVMACRQSGYAFLGSASVQEAQDFALIAQAATLASRVPFVHFFDGFRTSHEISKIENLSDEMILNMMDYKDIDDHRNRALNPDNPVLRGSSQGPDVFFESREATNKYYDVCPEIVQSKMDDFAKLTGRAYRIFEYYGHPEAEQLIISMASSVETISATIDDLNKKGEKYGLIKVRLFRPFSKKHVLEALPKTVKAIAVLDRTKEVGSAGEPLYLDVLHALTQAFQNAEIAHLPKVIGGRYGLSSKAFTPSMVNAIFQNLKQERPLHNFTVGIEDDITHLSLPKSNFKLKLKAFQMISYGYKPNNNEESEATGLISILGNESSSFVQFYTEIDYKKTQSRQVRHIRFADQLIKAPYLIAGADVITCENSGFIENDSALQRIKTNGKLLVNSELSPELFWKSLKKRTQQQIIEKELSLYIVNLNDLKTNYALENFKISALDACFYCLTERFGSSAWRKDVSHRILKVDCLNETDHLPIEDSPEINTPIGFIEKLLNTNQNTIKVSDVPVDGTYPTNTSILDTPEHADFIPEWHPEACIQCGACSMVCPQAALRMKVFDDSYLEAAPDAFATIPSIDFKDELFSIQINPDHCNSCDHCIEACPEAALKASQSVGTFEVNKTHWDYFDAIPEFDRHRIDNTNLSQQQLQEPLFKYSKGELGCGEAPYLKLLSQLFGDRLLVANATGSSSIFGGALPTTPWAKNANGKGPAWSNSLFEDNAEFGLGFCLSLDQQEQKAKKMLKTLFAELDFDLAHDIWSAKQHTEQEILKQRQNVEQLKGALKAIGSHQAMELLKIADSLVKKSVWCVGGDGWAYDIGYGGLDHVLSSGKNINILVLDNEGYANTGGQVSKATPFGASAKFGFNGKQKQKKDLGFLAMNYDDVYVASVAIGADKAQTLKAFIEAERFDGPSIIIAYCHSASHGINIKTPQKYHKALVDSGQWLLYRNDPGKESPFQLDSKKPSMKIKDYLSLESRFSKLFQDKDDSIGHTLDNIQDYVDRRYKKYRHFSNLSQ